MSKSMLAGAACLVAAPLLAIVSTVVLPTMSDDAPTLVTAAADHRGAMATGLTLEMIALALLVAGSIWLALAVRSRAPRLALAGGILAVAGHFAIVFTNGMGATAPAIVSALDRAQAVATVKAVHASAGMSAVEPLSILAVIGFIVLGVGLGRAAAPAAAALALGSAIETAGFATGTRAAVIAGFAILCAGAIGAARSLAGRDRLPAEERPGVAFELGR